MPGPSVAAKKEAYHKRFCVLLAKYEKAFLVHADNVGSQQFQDIRRGLRPQSVILMGKNTMMKRSIRQYIEDTGDDKWSCLLEVLVGNVGIVFTESDLPDVKAEIEKYKVGAAARVGVIAPNAVMIPGGPTGMDPSQTSFFQALGIATKITKGTIEMTADVHLIKPGDKVGASQATLLAKLGIKPFKYGLGMMKVIENGQMYDCAVLDITDEQLLGSVAAAVGNIAALSLAANFPTMASIPHSIINGYKNVLSVCLGTEYEFPLAAKVKEMLANPGAFAAAAPAAAAAAPAAAAAAPPPKEESEEEDMGFSLFD